MRRFDDEQAAWNEGRLGSERLATVAAWPLTLELAVEGLGRVLVCHSTPGSDEPIYTRATPDDDVLAAIGPVEADVLVCGHTHMHYDRAFSSGLRMVNPGSVGLPYEGQRGAFWAVLGPDVEFRRSEYDVVEAVAAARALGAPRQDMLELLVDPKSSDEVTAYFESLRGS